VIRKVVRLERERLQVLEGAEKPVRTVAAQRPSIGALVVLACLFFASRGGAQVLDPGGPDVQGRIPQDRPGDEKLELPEYQSPRERVPVWCKY